MFPYFPAALQPGGSTRWVNRRRKRTSGEKVMDLRVHLKVCEGCGCLWYRSQLETGVYCVPCARRFQEFPTPQSRKRRGRPKKITLPVVFAVEDSGCVTCQGNFANLATNSLLLSLGQNKKYRPHPALRSTTDSKFSTVQNIPASLLASPAVHAAAASVFPGGAQ